MIASVTFDTRTLDEEAARPIPLGIVLYNDTLASDALLGQCAQNLRSIGYRVGGIVQSNAHRRGRRKCDMFLTDLLSGEEVLISADRGNDAKGCRLDLAAFARVTLWAERALAQGVDLLVLNKFGKEEALGRGLRPVLAEALIAEIPVVLGVSKLNLCSLLDFVGHVATYLPADVTAVTTWCRKSLESRHPTSS